MDLIINRRHANQGRRDSNDKCPTVVALKSAGFLDARVTTWPAVVEVATDDTRCGGPGIKWEKFTMPKSLRNAIDAYDSGGDFKIGRYRIIGLRRPKGGKR